MGYAQALGNSKIKLEELFFYFDSQEKDWFDKGRLGRKNGQVLALRQKLLSMPDGDFDMAIGAIERIVDGRTEEKVDPMIQRKTEQKSAVELFERVQNGPATSTPANEVSRV